jgi:hypothetical protein
MAHECLFPYSQEPAIASIGPKPDDSSAHPPTPVI